MITALDDSVTIDWTALVNAQRYYLQHFFDATTDHDNIINDDNSHPGSMHRWMLETWGIDHTSLCCKIVNEKKYMLFLLRWA